MENFCKYLGENAKEVIDFEKKEMLPLTKKLGMKYKIK